MVIARIMVFITSCPILLKGHQRRRSYSYFTANRSYLTSTYILKFRMFGGDCELSFVKGLLLLWGPSPLVVLLFESRASTEL